MRTVWVPDYGDGRAWHQPVQIPEPGEEGYKTPAERAAAADPGDPWAPIIAREQAIEEYLDAHPGPETGETTGKQYETKIDPALEPDHGPFHELHSEPLGQDPKAVVDGFGCTAKDLDAWQAQWEADMDAAAEPESGIELEAG
jgi:hypothetical protein